MRSALISIGVATLITVSMAWPQGRTADAPSRVLRGPLRSTTDADVAGLLCYEPTGCPSSRLIGAVASQSSSFTACGPARSCGP
jgi:hypothetical protein